MTSYRAETVLNTTFHANHGTKGGAVYNFGVSTFIDCTFSGNEATVEGGAIYEIGIIPDLTGCRFFDNVAERGGAIYIYTGNPAITACTFGGMRDRGRRVQLLDADQLPVQREHGRLVRWRGPQ